MHFEKRSFEPRRIGMALAEAMEKGLLEEVDCRRAYLDDLRKTTKIQKTG